MRAMVCEQLDGPSALKLAQIPCPAMGPNDARIAVKAAGVNFPDILMTEGKYQVKPDLPFVPGLEVAGEVIAFGENVKHLQVGQRVVGFARSGGGYAEEIVLPGAIVAPIPDAVDFVTAAAFPVAYGTAHFALAYRGQLQAGETLVVLGAAGGVGVAAIEIGKMLGARVIAVARGEEKLTVARAHGADEVIDYGHENLRNRLRTLTDGKGVDVIFDPVGGEHFDACVRSMHWEGRLLVVGFASGDIPRVATNLILVKNFSVVGVVFGAHSDRFPDDSRRRLTELFPMVVDGTLTPRVWKTLPLEDAASALAAIAGREVIGKAVLTIGP